jgi:hypothetical protein
VVHVEGVDFNNLELYMELYDGSLRKWLEDTRVFQKKNITYSDIFKILHDILLGLVGTT